MQIITVAPIVRGALQEHLTYFSKEDLDIGAVVMVPIRTREVPAIVLEVSAVSDAKSVLKSSDYAIRKITRAKPRRIWTPAFLRAAEHTANFFAQKLGETLLTLTPKTILDAQLAGDLGEPKLEQGSDRSEVLATQGDTKTRLESYQRLVRESFVRHESVFVCLPTETDVERVGKELGQGIETYTFIFNSSVTKKKILERWRTATKEEHAILVVGTAQYLGLPRHFKTIILDEEHSHGWKTMTRPLLDLRTFVEEYAQENGSNLIIGAPVLRAETYEQVRTGTIGEFGRIAARTLSDVDAEVIDPRIDEKELRETTGRRELIILTNAMQTLLSEASTRHEHVLLLAARKGLAPVTSCGDCGTLVRCPQCETPLVIHRVRGEAPLRALAASNPTSKKVQETILQDKQLYICHACGFMRTPEDNVHETCPNCKSWRLQGVGIGIDRIEEGVATLFPELPLFVLDGDRAKTRTQAKKLVEQFEKSRGGILIATPMAIPLLSTIENTGVISIDSLFAIPDIRMSERIFALMLALREKTTHQLHIQTRADDRTIFEQALRGDLAAFTENELALRKAFAYPPYGTIIKITLKGKRADIANEMERLKTFLDAYAPIVPGTMARLPEKNMFRMHMILKLAADTWPDGELIAKLRTLPPQFTIEINPDHLL